MGGSLHPWELKRFLKKFRVYLAPTRIRFYAVGEYGDRSLRPHYHLSVFGVGPECLPLAQKAWMDGDLSLGFVSAYEFNEQTAQYVCGYIMKKMTKEDDPRLDGRFYPEFARQSNRPGIGAPAMRIVADALFKEAGVKELLNVGDVPMALKMGNKSLPLGRYLRGVLRDEVGLPPDMVKAKQEEWQEEAVQRAMLFLQESKSSGEVLSFSKMIVRENLQKIRNIKGRSKIKSARRSL